MRLSPNAHDDPAWDAMTPRIQTNAKRALDTIATRFGGALIGPSPLTRVMMTEHDLGHASTMEALAALTAHDLLHQRDTPQGPAFWIPDRLVTTRRPTPRRSEHRNGTPTVHPR